MSTPRLVVFSSLFPNELQPNSGVFIRERMFRVGQTLPMVVVAPVPWFPLQRVIRRWKPGFRPQPPRHERQQGIDVYHPRFISVPGLFKSSDGLFMALGALLTLRRLSKTFKFNIIDAHFAFPDGYAGVLLGRWFKVPVTITLRGTEVPLSRFRGRKKRIGMALQRAARVFSVAESLKTHVTSLGAEPGKIRVVGNGVDIEKFTPCNKDEARRRLGIAKHAKVMISVGGLVERKGYHRIIELIPQLLTTYPDLLYLIVGGASAEGDIRVQLEQQVTSLGLENHVRFMGAMPSEELRLPLSAADLFVLATSNEGWANVFLEAMACGLPVVTTDVGGNREVIANDELGVIVKLFDSNALAQAINHAFEKNWCTTSIIDYAKDNAWDKRVDILVEEFRRIATG